MHIIWFIFYFIVEIYFIMEYLVEYIISYVHEELPDIETFFSGDFLVDSVVLFSKCCSFIYAHFSAKEFIPDKKET